MQSSDSLPGFGYTVCPLLVYNLFVFLIGFAWMFKYGGLKHH